MHLEANTVQRLARSKQLLYVREFCLHPSLTIHVVPTVRAQVDPQPCAGARSMGCAQGEADHIGPGGSEPPRVIKWERDATFRPAHGLVNHVPVGDDGAVATNDRLDVLDELMAHLCWILHEELLHPFRRRILTVDPRQRVPSDLKAF